MNMELNHEDVSLLGMLLSKELEETRIEIRHAKNAEYKNHLKDREERVRSLLGRVAPETKEAVSSKA